MIANFTINKIILYKGVNNIEQAAVLEYPFERNNAFGRIFIWVSDMEIRNIHFFMQYWYIDIYNWSYSQHY